MSLFRQFATMVIFILLSSCQYKVQKKGFSVGVGQLKTISYATVDQAIFRSNCYSCHGNSGGINVQSYNNVKNNIARIEAAIKHTGPRPMPPGGKLSNDLIALLDLWIAKGMPEQPVPVDPGELPGNPGDPGEPPPPLLATYTSLKFHVFSKCVGCHSANPSNDDLPPLNTREAILDPEWDLVDFNRPERSLIVELMKNRTFGNDDDHENEDDDAMPPPSSGIDPVTPEQIQVVEEWIGNGAPE